MLPYAELDDMMGVHMDVTADLDISDVLSDVSAISDLADKLVAEKSKLAGKVASKAIELATAAIVDLAAKTGVDHPDLEPTEYETERIANDIWRKVNPQVAAAFEKVAAAHDAAPVALGLEGEVVDAMNRFKNDLLAAVRRHA
jgi:hypothetical protein